MDRRRFYKLVAEVLPRFGGAAGLLDAVATAMQRWRTVGESSSSELDELQSLLHHDDLLGQVYQAINAPALEAAYRATARDRRKFSADEKFRRSRSFLRRNGWWSFCCKIRWGGCGWRCIPDSQLASRWKVKWLVKKDIDMGGTPLLRLQAEQVRICDPACGTMNFGLVAIDMLREIYREEGEVAGSGYRSPNHSDII